MTNAMVKKQNGNGYVSNFDTITEKILENSLRRFFDGNFWDAESQLPTGYVPVNIRETAEQYELDVIAPGCRKEDFNISLNENLLTISMNPEQEQKQQGDKTGWVRNEFVQHAFKRSFTLDDAVDLNNINASYKDGVLKLSLGKTEKTQNLSRNITIN